ncbi:hypothetical protein OEA41_001059 [Lepraria neglecta]|uniref:Transcription factor CBF/NF-Y/archaeal histone domain-containing protein n=1 Tax=Lepraria neglecta TaxID=209136 RepID=A0AAD9ZJE5_9LECA|nr:hypothetical protein OEA41_001059 [Lepraria neglecta]
MSVSPPKEGAEQGDATPENNSESMDRGEEVQAREAYDFEVKEQDRWLPIANGWSQSLLPAFSSYEIAMDPQLTPPASEKCQQEKRKTVNGEDILFAMTSTGFENYAEALKIYLAKYREFQSQSQRGDNQNQPRPGSGYGAAAAQSTASGASVGAGTDPSTTTTYQGQEEGVNSILSPHGLDPSQPQAGYGAVYPPAANNNGVGNEPY